MSIFKNFDKQLFMSYFVIFGSSIGLFLWFLLLYWTIGTKWPPEWRFGTVESIPGETRYSTSGGAEFPGIGSHPFLQKGLIPKQHVKGPTPEPVIPEEGK